MPPFRSPTQNPPRFPASGRLLGLAFKICSSVRDCLPLAPASPVSNPSLGWSTWQALNLCLLVEAQLSLLLQEALLAHCVSALQPSGQHSLVPCHSPCL